MTRRTRLNAATSNGFSGVPGEQPGYRYTLGGGFDAGLSRNVIAHLNYDLPLLGDSNTISGYSLWAGIGAGF